MLMTQTAPADRPLDLQLRDALRWAGGVIGPSRPQPHSMRVLAARGLVYLRDPDADRIEDGYRPTPAGDEKLRSIGERG
jgi:hypothetical protein